MEKKREGKTGLCTRAFFIFLPIYFLYGRKCRNLQGLEPSDGGTSLCPAMASNPGNDKRLGFDSHWCVASFPTIGIEEIGFHARILGIQLTSSAASTHTMKVRARSIDGAFHAIRGINRCLMEVLQLTDKVCETGRQVHKFVSCRRCGGHFQNKSLLTHHYNFMCEAKSAIFYFHELFPIIHRSALAATPVLIGACFEFACHLLAQRIRGRPTGPYPKGCQCSIRRPHRSCRRRMM